MQTVRQRLVDLFVTMDLKVDGTASGLRRSQRTDGSWGNINYEDTNRTKWDAYKQIGRAMLMARAFREADDRDEVLADGARKALAYWARSELRNPNWWWNEIGIPHATGITCLLLSVADPAHEDGTVTLQVNRRLSGEGATIAQDGNTRIDLPLPVGLAAGTTVSRALQSP